MHDDSPTGDLAELGCDMSWPCDFILPTLWWFVSMTGVWSWSLAKSLCDKMRERAGSVVTVVVVLSYNAGTMGQQRH